MIYFCEPGPDIIDDILHTLDTETQEESSIGLSSIEVRAMLKTQVSNLRAQIYIISKSRCIVALDEPPLL